MHMTSARKLAVNATLDVTAQINTKIAIDLFEYDAIFDRILERLNHVIVARLRQLRLEHGFAPGAESRAVHAVSYSDVLTDIELHIDLSVPFAGQEAAMLVVLERIKGHLPVVLDGAGIGEGVLNRTYGTRPDTRFGQGGLDDMP
jgi:hypothetical protein